MHPCHAAATRCVVAWRGGWCPVGPAQRSARSAARRRREDQLVVLCPSFPSPMGCARLPGLLPSPPSKRTPVSSATASPSAFGLRLSDVSARTGRRRIYGGASKERCSAPVRQVGRRPAAHQRASSASSPPLHRRMPRRVQGQDPFNR